MRWQQKALQVPIVWCVALFWLAFPAGQHQPASATVEILRDHWGVPHVYASTAEGGFFGLGYVTAEDRILQMDLFRRRARGRLAEVFGPTAVPSDRLFRLAGVGRYCDEAAERLPAKFRSYLQAYAAGVNAWIEQHPEEIQRRFQAYGVQPYLWSEGDCICAWMAVGTLFDTLYDAAAVSEYHAFRQRAAEIGEPAALAERQVLLDDVAAVVPESEMAKNPAVYSQLKATAHMPGYQPRAVADELLTFSHAWAVDGTRSATGKPLLESDPQVSVSNPPLWYEFHLHAGEFNVRGIGVAGAPGLLIGFNQSLAWGLTALGAHSTVTFVERLAGEESYWYKGAAERIQTHLELIRVRGADPVRLLVRRTRHGFVFNELVPDPGAGELYVSYHPEIEHRRTTLQAMLEMMSAGNWNEFRKAMENWYSPGVHLVYADAAGNIGYQTLLYLPLTRRTRRIAFEGWTGEDEILGRVRLDLMPHMLNPERHFISHANNLPVGSWYPYELAAATGHTNRSWRLVQLLSRPHLFTVDSFESEVHRDDVEPVVAVLFPIARRLVERLGRMDRNLDRLLAALRDWDLRYRASDPAYPAAMALASSMLTPFRRSVLSQRVGGGQGGLCRLARLLQQQYGERDEIPQDPDVRAYLLEWLQQAAQAFVTGGVPPGPRNGQSQDVHRMPYQQNGPMQLPVLVREWELVSPPLACGQIGTIWSQKGNSYTQIVDLADPDRSRALLPPGISENPASRDHTNQMDLWVAGGTRPAPLRRAAVERITRDRWLISSRPYEAPDPYLFTVNGQPGGLAAAVVQRVRADGSQTYELAVWYNEILGRWEPVAVKFAEGEQVYLLLFGFRIRYRSSLDSVEVLANGIPLPVVYAGPQGVYPQLDQINVALPRFLEGAGRVELQVLVDGRRSNTVWIVIG